MSSDETFKLTMELCNVDSDSIQMTKNWGSDDHFEVFNRSKLWIFKKWQRFPSEVSKFTSARKELNLSLKYWFLEANVVFWIWYGCKKW